MDEPQKHYITRDACALYFAARSVAHTALCCSFFALLLILVRISSGKNWDSTVGTVLFSAQVHLFILPVVLLIGLQTGENLWRNHYHPDKARFFRRILFWMRAIFAVLGLAMLILLRGIPSEFIIFSALAVWIVLEVYFQRARRAEVYQIAPGMRTLGAIAVLSFLFLTWVIWSMADQMQREGDVVVLQIFTIGCLSIYELNDTVNIMWKWEQQGRLPPEGNHRFQIQLSTILLIVCGLGLWGALLKWTFF